MKYLSLFSGIEAASCAWQPLGWELAGVCEIEKFPCNVLKHHYPQVPNLGDITKITKAQLEALGSIDLIVGGSPCLTGETLVLTRSGWKPLFTVTAYDLLWDGENWVHHHGVIYKGYKKVMAIDGVCMTPNHLIWYPEHNAWREAGDWFPEDTEDDRIAMVMMENSFNYLPEQYRVPDCNARGHTIAIDHQPKDCTEANVYDILDVGLHNRFMIRTNHGVLIAHNCQGFSIAGKQEGLNDIRSKLAIDYLRVINTVKPRWIVWENVPGVFSTNKGMDFRLFTEVLTQCGFGLCWRVLDAQWFRVSQRRRRVFLIGYLGDWRPAYKVLFESESLPRYLATLERTKERLTGSTERGTRKTGDCYDMNHPCDVIRTYDDGKTPTLEARMGTGGNNIPLVTDDTVFLERQFFGSYIGKASTLTRDIYRDPPAVTTHARVRKLTPTECLRLQGFPDDWFKDVEGYSDTAAYKAIGNSMAVPCMRWIGERIALIDKELNNGTCK